jgi:isochorismate hydrolase
MYLVRRIYTVKPGEARRAATLIDAIGAAYEEAGTRGPSTVYFNSGTTPGEKDRVVMEWKDEALMSPYREDRIRVEGLEDVAAQLREISLGSEIEFWELMTDEKRV